jgi:hypothetical protein
MCFDQPQIAALPVSDVDLIDADLITEVREALILCRDLLVTATRDTSVHRGDALMTAVLCGWDCEAHLADRTHQHDGNCAGNEVMEDLAIRHCWSPEWVAKLRRMRSAVAAITFDPERYLA